MRVYSQTPYEEELMKTILVLGEYKFLKHLPNNIGGYKIKLSMEKKPWSEYFWFSKYYSHIVLFSFGSIISKESIKVCRPELLNLHPSPLPSYKGANPIQAQFVDGVKTSVVTLQKVAPKVDTGKILSTAPYNLSTDSVEDIVENAAKAGVEALRNYLEPKPVTIKNTSSNLFIGHEGEFLITDELARYVWFMQGKCWFRNKYHEKVFIKTNSPEAYSPELGLWNEALKDPNNVTYLPILAYKREGKNWVSRKDYINGNVNKKVK
jgi:hypothetical protein